MIAAALSLIADTFKEGAARARALGIYAGAAGGAGSVGLAVLGTVAASVTKNQLLNGGLPAPNPAAV